MPAFKYTRWAELAFIRCHIIELTTVCIQNKSVALTISAVSSRAKTTADGGPSSSSGASTVSPDPNDAWGSEGSNELALDELNAKLRRSWKDIDTITKDKLLLGKFVPYIVSLSEGFCLLNVFRPAPL